MKLASILSKEGVLPRLSCGTKKQALKMIAGHAEALTGVEASEIFDVLMAREQKSGTGVGSGAAIPHGRFERLMKPCMLFASLKQSIEFGAFDGHPVDLLFVLMVPASSQTEHVKGMALASRLLRDKELCRALRLATDAATLYDLLVSHEGNA